MTEPLPKMVALDLEARKAYDAEDQPWFDALPTEDLAALWGSICVLTDVATAVPRSVTMPAYDDEVYEALAARGWFEAPVKPVCEQTAAATGHANI